MTCRLPKARRPLQESFVYILMQKSEGKIFIFGGGKYHLRVVKLKDYTMK